MSIGMEKRKEEKKVVETGTGIRVAFIGIAVWIISF